MRTRRVKKVGGLHVTPIPKMLEIPPQFPTGRASLQLVVPAPPPPPPPKIKVAGQVKTGRNKVAITLYSTSVIIDALNRAAADAYTSRNEFIHAILVAHLKSTGEL